MRVSMKRFFVCALCLCCAAFPVLAGKAGASAESGAAPGTLVLDSLADRYGPVTLNQRFRWDGLRGVRLFAESERAHSTQISHPEVKM